MLRDRLAACVMAALCGVGADQASAQTSYPLVCRGGGGDMELSLFVQSNSAVLRFMPGDQGASFETPEPSSCAWLDRGWREGEPDLLAFPANSDAARYVFENMMSGAVFYVHAYNNGGEMVVTRVGP